MVETENQKALIEQGLALPIMEQFYTIQGEGMHTGMPAYFIRLGGCDVGCVWCDVKESWDATAHPIQSVHTIVQAAVDNSESRLVVITGGEPAMYNLEPLCTALIEAGFQLHIETSGAYMIQGTLDWVTVSPKKFKAPLPEVLEHADELKVVIYNKSDFAWAEEHAAFVDETCGLLLQPEWDKREAMMPLIVEYVKANPKWSISLQTHKYLGVD